MNKVAVFGNAGGGKSTLSKHLAEMTGLPMVPNRKTLLNHFEKLYSSIQ